MQSVDALDQAMKNKINVTSSSMPPIEEYIEAIRPLWETRHLTNHGQIHNRLTAALREYLGVQNVSLFTNGHMALEAAVQVLGLTGEVITTPFTYASTTQSIVHSGLTPVFCDVTDEDLTMDPEKIEALITEKTSAIMPVHVYGRVCDVDAIKRIAQKHRLKVIYDAAHAFGETKDGVGVGSFGDVSMFSLHATKVYHTVEGGALTFGDGALAREFQAWRKFGMYDAEIEDVRMPGTNAKMTEFHAAMGICNLKYIGGEIEKRKNAALHYRRRLGGMPGLRLFEEQPGVVSCYSYFPVLIDSGRFGRTRDEVFDALQRGGINARRYFYPLTSAFTYYQNRFPIQRTPVAERAASMVLALPLYADLTLADVDRICDLISASRR